MMCSCKDKLWIFLKIHLLSFMIFTSCGLSLFTIDDDTRLVCKYLRAYQEERIDRLYKHRSKWIRKCHAHTYMSLCLSSHLFVMCVQGCRCCCAFKLCTLAHTGALMSAWRWAVFFSCCRITGQRISANINNNHKRRTIADIFCWLFEQHNYFVHSYVGMCLLSFVLFRASALFKGRDNWWAVSAGLERFHASAHLQPQDHATTFRTVRILCIEVGRVF